MLVVANMQLHKKQNSILLEFTCEGLQTLKVRFFLLQLNRWVRIRVCMVCNRFVERGLTTHDVSDRSSHRRCSIKQGVKNFDIIAGKHLHCSLFLIFSFIFSCEYCEIYKSTYFEEHLRTATSDLSLQQEVFVHDLTTENMKPRSIIF